MMNEIHLFKINGVATRDGKRSIGQPSTTRTDDPIKIAPYRWITVSEKIFKRDPMFSQ